ncbi:hypothetical protein GCM10027174_34440 [Salinifilum aidingensis]
METTTDAVSSTRVRSDKPAEDPAPAWEPLPRLTEAAAAVAGSTASVAITRGFDRTNRERAKALRSLLQERNVPAIEITPAPGSERLLADADIAAVVNLIGAGSWQPYRIAAELGAPVLTPNPTEQSAEEVQRHVIALEADDGKRDIALSHVAIRADSADGKLTVAHDTDEVSTSGGWLSVTAQDGALQLELGGQDVSAQQLSTTSLRVQVEDTPHRLVRDELPIADYEGTLTLTAEANGLTVRPV